MKRMGKATYHSRCIQGPVKVEAAHKKKKISNDEKNGSKKKAKLTFKSHTRPRGSRT
jgi:hypothetical protein